MRDSGYCAGDCSNTPIEGIDFTILQIRWHRVVASLIIHTDICMSSLAMSGSVSVSDIDLESAQIRWHGVVQSLVRICRSGINLVR